jgi:hypothetical protein
MEFKEWLKLHEVGTGTNAVAVFSRPSIGMVQREPIDMIGFRNNDDNKKKKKNYIDHK